MNVRPLALLVLAAQSQNRQSFRADLGRLLRTGNLLNRLSRLVATSGLAVFCLGATALAQDGLFDLAPTSASGSFLAGTQALNELRTPEASRFFADAIAEEWDNPIILNRAFVAFAANGEVERASDTAARILELEPANELAQLVRATEAIKQRKGYRFTGRRKVGDQIRIVETIALSLIHISEPTRPY